MTDPLPNGDGPGPVENASSGENGSFEEPAMSPLPVERGGGSPAQEKKIGRKPAKTVSGVVVSAKMQKTIAVDVIRLERHLKYKKYVRRTTRYKAHDERQEAKEGDVVRIAQARPLSKTKRWRLVEVVSSAKRGIANEAGAGTSHDSDA